MPKIGMPPPQKKNKKNKTKQQKTKHYHNTHINTKGQWVSGAGDCILGVERNKVEEVSVEAFCG